MGRMTAAFRRSVLARYADRVAAPGALQAAAFRSRVPRAARRRNLHRSHPPLPAAIDCRRR
jgi:hypothetical protein